MGSLDGLLDWVVRLIGLLVCVDQLSRLVEIEVARSQGLIERKPGLEPRVWLARLWYSCYCTIREETGSK